MEDHTEYQIWVLDVGSGAEWRVLRRFRAFFDMFEKLVAMRPSLARIDFPPRRGGLYETYATVQDRKVRLERWLRRISSLLFYAPLHSASNSIMRVLQNFLDVPKRIESLELMSRQPDKALRQAVQVHVFRILSLPVFR